MAITGPRRTIGQKARESGYSQALAHDKYQTVQQVKVLVCNHFPVHCYKCTLLI